MQLPNFSLTQKPLKPYSLIYLIKDNSVLLMQRISTKSLMAGVLLGLGGKVEPTEKLIPSVQREFYEETGLTIKNPALKGTFLWLDLKKQPGISYIFVAYSFTGEMKRDSPEGKINWYPIENLKSNTNLAEYQKKFLPEILYENSPWYCGLSVFHEDRMIEYTDNKISRQNTYV